ncbi:MAG: hypothetical protein BLM47_00065 [Candidatus Reconcilbacillus cellulovorans]|uniref:Cyanophage baseplate Pam3 plug gp18 domain-containing protein n=1 Tax=Candidatus Reconcilbacillus cellulovorans TaxID=1906605 RepID=A0A2A6E3G2_9BACL|nr:MAG: hypothetical protein BLM47_00065 [Candidatus Reconcilbacillus cellulovorans]
MYIPIQKNQVPYRFEILLGAEPFEIEVRYNADFDFFTLDLYKDGEALVYGEKLVYGVPLFVDVFDQRFPVLQLVPRDDAGLEERVGYANLGETVFLRVVE